MGGVARSPPPPLRSAKPQLSLTSILLLWARPRARRRKDDELGALLAWGSRQVSACLSVLTSLLYHLCETVRAIPPWRYPRGKS